MVTSSDLKDTRYMALQLGATDFLGKPIDEIEFVTRVRNLLALSLHHKFVADRADWLAEEVDKATRTMVEALTRTIAVLSRAIEMRDPYTDGHQKRVSALAVATAAALGLPSDRITGVRLGSLVHDVGKIAVPAELLSCPRKLTAPEIGMIRSHPVIGRDILAEAEFPWPLVRMVAEHHERMDGSGYPDGLAGEAICLEARIIAVADVVEAMSSHRPYRPALGMEAAMAEIRRNRGRFYDPEVVDCCLSVLAGAEFAAWGK
jgi:HD-GYP domain-containing protein (c-di-GMP phosphodiesterase class II)